jgi:sec-independent protein translocase protein TatB
MFDLSWSEMLVIVVVALIVIGPKDLPRLVREVGRWTSKARGMAREFQRSFDDMVREAELEDIRKGLEKTRPGNIAKTIRETVDPEGEFDRAFDLEERKTGDKAGGKIASAAKPPVIEDKVQADQPRTVEAPPTEPEPKEATRAPEPVEPKS